MDINRIIFEFLAARETEKQAKKEKERLQTLLSEFMGSSNAAETDIYTIIRKETESTRLDTASLCKDFPDIKAEYGKTVKSVSFAIAEKAAEKKSA